MDPFWALYKSNESWDPLFAVHKANIGVLAWALHKANITILLALSKANIGILLALSKANIRILGPMRTTFSNLQNLGNRPIDTFLRD